MRQIAISEVTAIVLSVALSGTAQTTPPDRCADVLRNGVFNVHTVHSTAANSDNYRKWECTATYTTHDEAIKAGLSVGLELFDIPLSLGGTWAHGTQETWKQNHCTSDERSASSSSTFYEFVKTADPGILAAWSRCMENNGPSASAISCSVEKPGNDRLLFKSRWRRTAGENPSQKPIVSYYRVFDAACDRAWNPKDALAESDTTFTCDVPNFSQAVFVLETSRGACTLSDEALQTTEEISGKVVLDDLKNYQADRIIFRDHALIVTNGNKLSFRATEIKVEGTAKIVSFEPRANRPLAGSGRSAGAVIIVAERIIGTPLRIENFGENGTQGSAGSKGPKGGNGIQGTQRDWDLSGCHGGSNGTPGGMGVQGGTGGRGWNGGTGGSVFYSVRFGIGQVPLSKLDILTTREVANFQDRPLRPLTAVDCGGPCGGLPGAGGDGGPGGDGGEGGLGAPGTDRCGGTDAGPHGPGGPAGPTGPEGGAGAPGVIQDVTGH